MYTSSNPLPLLFREEEEEELNIVKVTRITRDKNATLRMEPYKKIVALGIAENDVDDLVSMLYDFWKEHHKGKTI